MTARKSSTGFEFFCSLQPPQQHRKTVFVKPREETGASGQAAVIRHSNRCNNQEGCDIALQNYNCLCFCQRWEVRAHLTSDVMAFIQTRVGNWETIRIREIEAPMLSTLLALPSKRGNRQVSAMTIASSQLARQGTWQNPPPPRMRIRKIT